MVKKDRVCKICGDPCSGYSCWRCMCRKGKKGDRKRVGRLINQRHKQNEENKFTRTLE